MTPAQATQAGYKALTTPFHVRTESAMMEAVVCDMKRAGTPYLKVEVAPGRVEVWRKNWVELPNPTRSLTKGIRGSRV
jgi:hypothetical protein